MQGQHICITSVLHFYMRVSAYVNIGMSRCMSHLCLYVCRVGVGGDQFLGRDSYPWKEGATWLPLSVPLVQEQWRAYR